MTVAHSARWERALGNGVSRPTPNSVQLFGERASQRVGPKWCETPAQLVFGTGENDAQLVEIMSEFGCDSADQKCQSVYRSIRSTVSGVDHVGPRN